MGGSILDNERCLGDLDCAESDACSPVQCIQGACVELTPVICNDDDPCTEDRCIPETGECEFRPLTSDEDGDGFRAPLPGFAPGAPGSCGNDCDDTSKFAFPGGVEVCDGVDNDCNGIVDEDANYVPVGTEPVRVSGDVREAAVGGLAFNGDYYGVLYGSQIQSWENDFKGLSPLGDTIIETKAITRVNTDAFSGPVVWTGAVFGTVWEDRRDGDYEIYFNRLGVDGDKLGPDLRVTTAPDFSLRPDLLFNGSEFIVVWSDRRNGRGDYRIYGQRITLDGRLLGPNIELTPAGLNAEAPQIAAGKTTLGISFNIETVAGRQVAFRTASADLSELGEIVEVSAGGAAGSSLVFNGSDYVATWYTRDREPGRSIRGAAITEDGRIRIRQRAVTTEARFARSHSLLPLGDRLLLIWAEWVGSDDGSYDLFTKMLDSDLDELTPKRQVTFTPYEVSFPTAAFGPEGDVGILFQALGTDGWQVYFTRLSCTLAP